MAKDSFKSLKEEVEDLKEEVANLRELLNHTIDRVAKIDKGPDSDNKVNIFDQLQRNRR